LLDLRGLLLRGGRGWEGGWEETMGEEGKGEGEGKGSMREC